jgi:hypothetical protein
MRTVKEYMATPVFQVEANTSLQEVCKLMLERGIGFCFSYRKWST